MKKYKISLILMCLPVMAMAQMSNEYYSMPRSALTSLGGKADNIGYSLIEANSGLLAIGTSENIAYLHVGGLVAPIESLPCIYLIPHNPPIQIPATGGSFDYTIGATNYENVSQLFEVWCDVTLPNGSIYGPVLGPVSIIMASGLNIERVRTQDVPPGAPAGTYSYNAYAVVGVDTCFDSFSFDKLGVDGSWDGETGWGNYGESFDEWMVQPEVAVPDEFFLSQNYPNPFNPVTTIRFALTKNSHTSITVYNLKGRVVAELVNGMREAGIHEVTWDASNHASGLYFYHIRAGDFAAVRKMVLVK